MFNGLYRRVRFAVLLGTLVWGLVITSSRFFLASAPAHTCCNPTGCAGKAPGKSPVREACRVLPVELGERISVSAPLAVGPVALTPLLPMLKPPAWRASATETLALAVEHSPPDLLALHSTFLI